MHKYPVRIFWSDEDASWIAVCAAFPYISAFGTTREEAAREMDDLIDEVVDTFEQEGKQLPAVEPEPTASGQLRLRLPRSLHDRASEQARTEEVSLNTLIVSALAERLGVLGGLAEMRTLRGEIVGMVEKQFNPNVG